jgi:hypothetical protein
MQTCDTWQSLKTVRSISLGEACIASTPVAVTINTNVNLGAILKKSEEMPRKRVKGKAKNADRRTVHDATFTGDKSTVLPSLTPGLAVPSARPLPTPPTRDAAASQRKEAQMQSTISSPGHRHSEADAKEDRGAYRPPLTLDTQDLHGKMSHRAGREGNHGRDADSQRNHRSAEEAGNFYGAPAGAYGANQLDQLAVFEKVVHTPVFDTGMICVFFFDQYL